MQPSSGKGKQKGPKEKEEKFAKGSSTTTKQEMPIITTLSKLTYTSQLLN